MAKLPNDFLTVSQLANYAHVTKAAIFIGIKREKFPATKIKKIWHVKRGDYDSWRATKFNREEKMVDGERIFDIEQGRYSVTQVAKVFSTTLKRPYPTARIYYMIRMGHLKAHRRGCSWVIDKQDAVDLLDKECGHNNKQLTFA